MNKTPLEEILFKPNPANFRSKHYCYMCEEGFNSLKEMINYTTHSFCSKQCLDKYKEFIRQFLKEKLDTEKLTDKMRHRIELWLTELEGED